MYNCEKYNVQLGIGMNKYFKKLKKISDSAVIISIELFLVESEKTSSVWVLQSPSLRDGAGVFRLFLPIGDP
jgi:hypothetical protein